MSTTIRVARETLSNKKLLCDSITLDPRGVAYIAGTTMKVRQVIMEAKGLNSTAEEIHEAHAHDGLTLSQVHAALDYYKLNKISIDAEIDEEDRYIEEARRTGYRPDVDALRARLKQKQSA
jgi:uncharacterized protein (DUF433 family)